MLTIRMAKKEDIGEILAVERECFEEFLRYSPAEMRYLLFEANSEGWVAHINGRIVGYYILLFRRNARVARLYSIAVAESWRGKGIGKALLQHAEERALKRGCNIMHLEVKTTNKTAISLYKRNGYSQIEFLQDYYKKGMHGIRMEKRL
ncbi:MAG: GNAT family N-acetyltransferase [Thermoplasmata archaeon]